MARYLEDGADQSRRLCTNHSNARIARSSPFPVLFVSARTGAGIPQLLDAIARLAPNPAEGNPPPFYRGEPGQAHESFAAVPDASRHVLAHVFQVIVDPFMGKLGVFPGTSGHRAQDSQLFVGSGKRAFKVAHLYRLHGKDYVEVPQLVPGDIGAVAKVDEIEFDCVLHDSHDEDHIHLQALEFPQPMQGLAVETKRKGDEQRLFDILHKLELEDPSFRTERHPTTNEVVIRGIGEMHLRSKLARMQQQYKLELDTSPPQIAYAKPSPAMPRALPAKAEWWCRTVWRGDAPVEPLPRGCRFRVRRHRQKAAPSRACSCRGRARCATGVGDGRGCGLSAAGYPGHGIRRQDARGRREGDHLCHRRLQSHHGCGSQGQSDPAGADGDRRGGGAGCCDGDLTGDLAGRRGHVTGTQTRLAGTVSISALAPLAELENYQGRLKSLTGQGRPTASRSRITPRRRVPCSMNWRASTRPVDIDD